MSDFAQSGLITTLQRLNETHLSTVEEELRRHAATHPIALVLPCHSRDFDTPAMSHILQELSQATWLNKILLSMNGDDIRERMPQVQAVADCFPVPMHVLWNYVKGRATGGKGHNFYGAIRSPELENRVRIVATQDCDVTTFRRQDLARLCLPLVKSGYQFAKAYYPRVTDRLYGRVTRLFVTPLLCALIRAAGHHPLLDFLLSFRYPLAGEVAMTLEVAGALPCAEGYTLEIAHLCEVFRHLDPRDVCQVDGGADYDHRHQPATTALAAMAGEIAAELFRQLAAEGLPATPDFRSAVASAYRREGALALRRSAALAEINGLHFDEEAEREAVASFAAQL